MDESQLYVIDYSNPNNSYYYLIGLNLCETSFQNQIGVNSEGKFFCIMVNASDFILSTFNLTNGVASSLSNLTIPTGHLIYDFISLDYGIIYAQPPIIEAIIMDSVLNKVVCNINVPFQLEFSYLAKFVEFEYNRNTNVTKFAYIYHNNQSQDGYFVFTYNCTDNTETHSSFRVPELGSTGNRQIFFMKYSGNSVYLLSGFDFKNSSSNCQIISNGSIHDSGFAIRKMIKLNDTDIIAKEQQNLIYYRLNSETSLEVIYNINFGSEIINIVFTPGQPIFVELYSVNFLINSSNFDIIKITPASQNYILFSNGSFVSVTNMISLYTFNGNNLYFSSYQSISSNIYSNYPYTDYWMIVLNADFVNQLLHINIQTNEVQVFNIPFNFGYESQYEILAVQNSSSTLFLAIYMDDIVSTLNNGIVTNQSLNSSIPLVFYNEQTSNLVYADQKLTEETYCIVDYNNWIFYVYDGFSNQQIQAINMNQVANMMNNYLGETVNDLIYYPVAIDPTNNSILAIIFYANGLNGYLNKDGYADIISNNFPSPSYNYFNTTAYASGSYFYQVTLTDWSSPEGFNENPTNWIVLLTIFGGAVVIFIIGVGVYLRIKRNKRLKIEDLKINLQMTEIKV